MYCIRVVKTPSHTSNLIKSLFLDLTPLICYFCYFMNVVFCVFLSNNYHKMYIQVVYAIFSFASISLPKHSGLKRCHHPSTLSFFLCLLLPYWYIQAPDVTKTFGYHISTTGSFQLSPYMVIHQII